MEGLKILIVDDEKDIVDMLAYNFEKEKMVIYKAYTGQEAMELAIKYRPDIIVLDVMLPDFDGIEVCERIRATDNMNNALIVFLSARGEDYSQLAGYKAGCDDYMVKPIKVKILIHKLKVLVDRFKKPKEAIASRIKIDRDRFVVEMGEKEQIIPKKEFELLALLLESPDKVHRRDDILRDVWNDAEIGDRTIDVHIRKLRERFGNNIIQTIKGVGYKFAG